MTEDYVPPEGDDFELADIAVVEKPDQTKSFEFDPDRSDVELAFLNTEPEPEPQSGPVKFWSFSTLSTFNQCPYRVYIRKVKGIKEPSSDAGKRGNRIHDQAEDYVAGRTDQLPETKKIELFENRFKVLRQEYTRNNVELEEEWGFTVEFDVIQSDGNIYKNPLLWYIAKLDVLLWESQTSARVIDHKSGKKFGNEMKHSQQAMQYAIAAFMRYPQLEFIQTEFWYLDMGEELIKRWTRDEAMVMLPRVIKNGLNLTTCDKFPPKPSKRNCMYCHYATSGDCDYAYDDL